MVCPVELIEKKIILREWRIWIDTDRGVRAPFKEPNPKDFSERSNRRIPLCSARTSAYRDAYAMIFMASDGEPIPVCGDLTVLHNLISENYLSYDEDKFTIEIGCNPLATKCFGLQHRGDNDKWYQAILNKR